MLLKDALGVMRESKEASEKHDEAVQMIISELLVRVAPKPLRYFIRGYGIASNIARDGRCIGHLHSRDCGEYKLKNVTQLKKHLPALRAAWKGIVTVSYKYIKDCDELQYSFGGKTLEELGKEFLAD